MNKNPNFNLEGKHFKDQRKINQHFIKSSNQSTNLQQVEYDKHIRIPSRQERKTLIFDGGISEKDEPQNDQFIIGGA